MREMHFHAYAIVKCTRPGLTYVSTVSDRLRANRGTLGMAWQGLHPVIHIFRGYSTSAMLLSDS